MTGAFQAFIVFNQSFGSRQVSTSRPIPPDMYVLLTDFSVGSTIKEDVTLSTIIIGELQACRASPLFIFLF